MEGSQEDSHGKQMIKARRVLFGIEGMWPSRFQGVMDLHFHSVLVFLHRFPALYICFNLFGRSIGIWGVMVLAPSPSLLGAFPHVTGFGHKYCIYFFVIRKYNYMFIQLKTVHKKFSKVKMEKKLPSN